MGLCSCSINGGDERTMMDSSSQGCCSDDSINLDRVECVGLERGLRVELRSEWLWCRKWDRN